MFRHNARLRKRRPSSPPVFGRGGEKPPPLPKWEGRREASCSPPIFGRGSRDAQKMHVFHISSINNHTSVRIVNTPTMFYCLNRKFNKSQNVAIFYKIIDAILQLRRMLGELKKPAHIPLFNNAFFFYFRVQPNFHLPCPL